MPISRIKTDGINDDAITSAKIGVDVIVADDLAANSVTVSELTNNAVTTAKIANDAVTGDKLANNITIAGTTTSTGALTASATSTLVGSVTHGTDSGDTRFNFNGPNQYRLTIKRGGNIAGQIGGGGADDLRFSNAAGATTMTLKSGKLGVGTESPSNKLHLYSGASGGTPQSRAALIIEASDGNGDSLQFLGSDSNFQSIFFGDASDNDVGRIAYSHSGNNMRFTVAGAERMRIDSSGHVGIAESSSVDGRLHINSTGQNNASGINILLECTSGGGRQWAHRISETGVNNGWYVIRDQTANKTRLQIHENIYWMINPNNEQTHVRIGTTGAIGTGYAGFELVRTSDHIGVMNIGKTYSGNTSAVKFWHSASQVGSITYSNSATAYNTSSDYRLKENVTADWDATTRLKQLNPVRFNFIADADTTVDGFLAHEVQSIVPEAITGTHNEVDDEGNPVYQGIDQGKLVPLLIKTIQELEARITDLESN